MIWKQNYGIFLSTHHPPSSGSPIVSYDKQPLIFYNWHGPATFQVLRPVFLSETLIWQTLFNPATFQPVPSLAMWWSSRLLVSTSYISGKGLMFKHCAPLYLPARGYVTLPTSQLGKYSPSGPRSEGIITRAPPSVSRLFTLLAFSDTSLIKWSRLQLNRWTNHKVNKPTECSSTVMKIATVVPFSWWSDRF